MILFLHFFDFENILCRRHVLSCYVSKVIEQGTFVLIRRGTSLPGTGCLVRGVVVVVMVVVNDLDHFVVSSGLFLLV